MKYIKLFEEFIEPDPLEILPDGALMKIWRNITWYSLDQKQVEENSQQIPTSLDKIVVIIGTDESYGQENTGYMATVATEAAAKDHNAIYAMVWKEGEEDNIVARIKVSSFLEGISQLVAWTEMEGHEITHVDVNPTRKLDITGHIAKDAASDMDKNGGSHSPKMRKIGPNRSSKISKLPINPN